MKTAALAAFVFLAALVVASSVQLLERRIARRTPVVDEPLVLAAARDPHRAEDTAGPHDNAVAAEALAHADPDEEDLAPGDERHTDPRWAVSDDELAAELEYFGGKPSTSPRLTRATAAASVAQLAREGRVPPHAARDFLEVTLQMIDEREEQEQEDIEALDADLLATRSEEEAAAQEQLDDSTWEQTR